MDNLSNFAEVLSELMVVRELTPKELALGLGLSEQTIYAWKQGSQVPTLSNLIALSNFFAVTLEYLAGRTDNMQANSSLECPPFYTRIRQVMKERGISTYALKKMSQYGSNFFKRWQNGSEPLLSTLIELADILDCTIDHLVGIED